MSNELYLSGNSQSLFWWVISFTLTSIPLPPWSCENCRAKRFGGCTQPGLERILNSRRAKSYSNGISRFGQGAHPCSRGRNAGPVVSDIPYSRQESHSLRAETVLNHMGTSGAISNLLGALSLAGPAA